MKKETGSSVPNTTIRINPFRLFKELSRAITKIQITDIDKKPYWWGTFFMGICLVSNNAKNRNWATPTYKSATTSLHPFLQYCREEFLDLIRICKIITLDSVVAFYCGMNSKEEFDDECIIIFSKCGEDLAGQELPIRQQSVAK